MPSLLLSGLTSVMAAEEAACTFQFHGTKKTLLDLLQGRL